MIEQSSPCTSVPTLAERQHSSVPDPIWMITLCHASIFCAAATNYHRFSSLKRHRYFILQSYKAGSHCPQINMSAGLHSSGVPREAFPHLFELLEAAHCLWLMGPFLLPTRQWTIESFSHRVTPTYFLPPSSIFEDPCR